MNGVCIAPLSDQKRSSLMEGSGLSNLSSYIIQLNLLAIALHCSRPGKFQRMVITYSQITYRFRLGFIVVLSCDMQSSGLQLYPTNSPNLSQTHIIIPEYTRHGTRIWDSSGRLPEKLLTTIIVYLPPASEGILDTRPILDFVLDFLES